MRYLLLILALLPLVSCSSLFYYPDHTLHFDPKKLGFSFQEISFKAADGTKLYAWYYPATSNGSAKTLGTIVQFHGNAENISSHSLALAWVAKSGYNLFSFDYRGYGKSEGDPSPKGCTQDGLAALEEAWELHSQDGKFIVHGQSLGGAVALRSVQEFKNRDKVDLIVLESTFASYRKVAFRVAKSHWQTIVASPFVWVFMSDRYSGESYLSENKSPILVVHDVEDPTVGFANGQEIYDEAKAPKLIWKPQYGEHISAFGHKELRQDYLDLLSRLGSPQSPFK